MADTLGNKRGADGGGSPPLTEAVAAQRDGTLVLYLDDDKRGNTQRETPLLDYARDMAVTAAQEYANPQARRNGVFDGRNNRALVMADPNNPDQAKAVFLVSTDFDPKTNTFTRTVNEALVMRDGITVRMQLDQPVTLSNPPTREQQQQLSEWADNASKPGQKELKSNKSNGRLTAPNSRDLDHEEASRIAAAMMGPSKQPSAPGRAVSELVREAVNDAMQVPKKVMTPIEAVPTGNRVDLTRSTESVTTPAEVTKDKRQLAELPTKSMQPPSDKDPLEAAFGAIRRFSGLTAPNSGDLGHAEASRRAAAMMGPAAGTGPAGTREDFEKLIGFKPTMEQYRDLSTISSDNVAGWVNTERAKQAELDRLDSNLIDKDGKAKALSPEEERRLPDRRKLNEMTAGLAARNAMDTNRDGSISADEITNSRLDREKLDVNGDRQVNEADFKAILSKSEQTKAMLEAMQQKYGGMVSHDADKATPRGSMMEEVARGTNTNVGTGTSNRGQEAGDKGR